jgi:6-phospho-3-hexuloisomerase
MSRPDFTECLGFIRAEVTAALARIDPAGVQRFCDELLNARRVFIAGAGRSGLVGRMFAMRLMHLGRAAHVVGEATTPAIGKRDLLVALSGSGKTESVLTIAKLAKEQGAKVSAVSTSEKTPLARKAHSVLVVPGTRPADSRQLLHSIFDQTLLLTLDAVTMMLAERLKQSQDSLAARHANL